MPNNKGPSVYGTMSVEVNKGPSVYGTTSVEVKSLTSISNVYVIGIKYPPFQMEIQSSTSGGNMLYKVSVLRVLRLT